MAGLMGCPLWLWARRFLPPGSLAAAPTWGLVLLPGRLLAAAVECWVLQRRMRQLLQVGVFVMVMYQVRMCASAVWVCAPV